MIQDDNGVRAAYPELTSDRADALLRGVIPVFDSNLSEAYGIGVRLIGSQLDSVARDELQPLEICSLLQAEGSLRRLGLFMLQHLTQKARDGIQGFKSVVEICLANNLFQILSKIAFDDSQQLLTFSTVENGDAVVLSELDLIVDILFSICCAEIYPDNKNLDIQSEVFFRGVAAAASVRPMSTIYILFRILFKIDI